MKNITMKALKLLILIGLVPLTSFAQNDAFFMTENDVFFRDASWSFTVNTQGFGETPLGSGLLILTAVGAGYVISKRRRNRKNNISKGTALLLAGLMLIGTTGCRKKIVEPIANVSDEIFITVKVNGGPRADITAAGSIVFEDGDKLYVGNDGKYKGYLHYSNGAFSGSIKTNGTSTDDFLHFYFMGGKLNPTISGTRYTIMIDDQTSSYPVIAYGKSTAKYYGEGAYTTTLENKCSLIKFNVDTPSESNIYLKGMLNKVTIDFSDNSIAYAKEGDGAIRMRAKNASNETWAIVLPQTDLTGAGEAITNGYTGSWDMTGVNLTGLNQYIGNGTGIAMSLTTPANIVDLSLVTTDVTLTDGCMAYGKLNGSYQISIAADANVTLRDVDITSLTNCSYPGLTCLGDAYITIKGINTVISGITEGFCLSPGIFIPEGYTLNIFGTDSDVLNAGINENASFVHGAGIGGGREMNCGNIVIYGGRINATGSGWGAGIGGSEDTSCGYIIINDGIVTATSDGAAGIGTGENGYIDKTSTCGDIVISGGTVTAYGGSYSAAIGSAANHCICGDISIAGVVKSFTAVKGSDAPNSIGPGAQAQCGTVTIRGIQYWDGNDYQNGGYDYLKQAKIEYPVQNSETFQTRFWNEYVGDHFTVTCTDSGDALGINIGKNNSVTINAKNGETITRVEFYCSWGSAYANLTTVTEGNLNWNDHDENGSIENVNASSVTMSNCRNDDNVELGRITVHFLN
ncbi:MAG: hypothetical protein J6P64_03345 [Bacteroidales bacterium]|nr:hypothetical protein [Bacteroidales bacterium]